jgi:hypothetical protein
MVAAFSFLQALISHRGLAMTSPNKRPNPKLDVLSGMLLLAACHALMVGLVCVVYFVGTQLIGSSAMFGVLSLLFAISLTQLIYVIPLCLWLRQRRQFDTLKGVIIGAVITVLLNGSCFLYVMHIINNMHSY